MTPLKFPTQAEQCESEFRGSEKTTSISKIAARMGAEKRVLWDRIVFTFDDDTSIEVHGRGKNHSIKTFLP